MESYSAATARLAGQPDSCNEPAMKLRIARRHNHFIFAVVQSGLTCLIAAGIASYPAPGLPAFVEHWLLSWIIAWLTMLPVVLLAAPAIHALANRLTQE